MAKLLEANRSVLRMLIKRCTPVLSCLIRSQLPTRRTPFPPSEWRRLAHRTMARLRSRTVADVTEPMYRVRFHFSTLLAPGSVGCGTLYSSTSSPRVLWRRGAVNERTKDFGFRIIASTVLSACLAYPSGEISKRPEKLMWAAAELNQLPPGTQPPLQGLIPSKPLR